jgi:RimJ/RimL family protein N-acetyltransferase
MVHPYWPVADLRLLVGPLLLRPLDESDVMGLARMLPNDVELNPDSPRYESADPAAARGTIVHQDYWRAMGTWTVDAWRLNFGVWQDGTLIGAQELEGNDFVRLRTVDTASLLAVESRGHGLGKQMRRAVLALAFGSLDAEYAITSAWLDNAASLGVSRSLGYAENGLQRTRRDDGVDDLVHLRMSRENWLAAGGSAGVTIENFEPCRPYFGLA